jgi:hypothetical protein
LWEAILPAECLVLPGDLEAVDRLLSDERFFEPFRAHFDATFGRPSIPIETYLRMMFLKHRYSLGYEPLCAEVNDSISWRRFCRVPLGERAPHPTTLMKITRRCGPDVVDPQRSKPNRPHHPAPTTTICQEEALAVTVWREGAANAARVVVWYPRGYSTDTLGGVRGMVVVQEVVRS